MVKLYENSFEESVCNVGGGLGIMEFDEVELINNTFDKLASNENGGSLVISNSLNIKVENNSFDHSVAISGGIIHLYDLEILNITNL